MSLFELLLEWGLELANAIGCRRFCLALILTAGPAVALHAVWPETRWTWFISLLLTVLGVVGGILWERAAG